LQFIRLLFYTSTIKLYLKNDDAIKWEKHHFKLKKNPLILGMIPRLDASRKGEKNNPLQAFQLYKLKHPFLAARFGQFGSWSTHRG